MQLPSTLTLDVAAPALQLLQQAVAAPGVGPLAIDASALEVFDSAALAVLLQARRLANAGGRGFEVHGAPAKLAQLAQLYGVAELLDLAPAA